MRIRARKKSTYNVPSDGTVCSGWDYSSCFSALAACLPVAMQIAKGDATLEGRMRTTHSCDVCLSINAVVCGETNRRRFKTDYLPPENCHEFEWIVPRQKHTLTARTEGLQSVCSVHGIVLLLILRLPVLLPSMIRGQKYRLRVSIRCTDETLVLALSCHSRSPYVRRFRWKIDARYQVSVVLHSYRQNDRTSRGNKALR